MSAAPGEASVLRLELRQVWARVGATMSAWEEQAAVFIGEIKRLTGKVASLEKHCEGLEEELRHAKRLAMMHENYNNPDRRTHTAKKRDEHRRALRAEGRGAECAVEVEKEDGCNEEGKGEGGGREKAGPRKRGGQPNSNGVSCGLRPHRDLDEWHAADRCALCDSSGNSGGV